VRVVLPNGGGQCVGAGSENSWPPRHCLARCLYLIYQLAPQHTTVVDAPLRTSISQSDVPMPTN
jgi:hypothetical protein